MYLGLLPDWNHWEYSGLKRFHLHHLAHLNRVPQSQPLRGQGKGILCSPLCLSKLWLLQACGRIFIPFWLGNGVDWGLIQCTHPQLGIATSLRDIVALTLCCEELLQVPVHQPANPWNFLTRLWFMIFLSSCFYSCTSTFHFVGPIHCLDWFESTLGICPHVQGNRYCENPQPAVLRKSRRELRKSRCPVFTCNAVLP